MRSSLALALVAALQATITATSVLLATGCLTGGSRGQALYPPTYPPPKPNEVAMLAGYVERVDNQDVSTYGKSFELLPGCHVIETPTEWGEFGNAGGVVVKTRRMVFALPMKPAHQYVVAIRTGQVTGPTGPAMVEATEKDLDGNTTNSFSPAQSRQDIEVCRQWEAQLHPPDKTSTAPANIGITDGGAAN